MLSIVLPINAHHRFFAKAILSIQSAVENLMAPSELIVIINGAQIQDILLIRKDLLSYQFPINIHIIKQSDLATALNVGVHLSQYEYIARMDSDDLCTSDRFVKQLVALDLNKELGVIGGQVILIDENGTNMGRSSYPLRIKNQLNFTNCIAHPTVMFRKSAILGAGGYSNDYPFAEDFDLWTRVRANWEIKNLKDVVLQYRVHDKQISTSKFVTQLFSTIEILAQTYEIDRYELHQELIGFNDINEDFAVSTIVNVPSIKNHSLFRSVVALMILRRGHRYTKNNSMENLDLFFISSRSFPFKSAGLVLKSLCRRFILGFLKKS